MSGPEEHREPGKSPEDEHVEPIHARPTANPSRVRMPADGPRKKHEGDPEESGPPPGEES
ncbi:hypothetical protein ACIBTV_21460 [Micromonospora sp. NPDC049366]|uniref:hypothetical protein n=1 Tax=Micromonospora sp. NPDC049366 TaxID=3364271 RepID=UPI0037AF75EF